MLELRTWMMGLAVALAATACKESKPASKTPPAASTDEIADPGGAGSAGAGATDRAGTDGDLTLPTRAVKGRAVTPVVTRSVTFVVPAAPGTWAEMSFACYAAGITMGGTGTRPRDPFEKVSPVIPAAMAAAGIDLDHDLAAFGGFACGGEPCMYFAMRMSAPGKIADALQIIPGADVEDHGDHHYSFAVPGAPTPRTIHVRVVPINWTGGTAPADPWTEWQTRATHVVFVHGTSRTDDTDPVTLLAEPDAAAAKVAATESVVADPRGRCVIGTVGPTDFKPGFELTAARFAMVAPTGRGDPLSRLVDSRRTLDVEVELTLDPAPTRADLDRWITESRAWIAEIAAPIRVQLAGQGDAFEVMAELFTLVGERGFEPSLKGPRLNLSWRTDRIRQADLDHVEARLEAVMP